MYTVEYFINKFKAIPECLWTTGTWSNDEGQKCVRGHCGEMYVDDENHECKALNDLFYKHFGIGAITINDAMSYPFVTGVITSIFDIPSPRGRILAALHMIEEMEKAEAPKVVEKIKTVYVTVPETLKEEAKE